MATSDNFLQQWRIFPTLMITVLLAACGEEDAANVQSAAEMQSASATYTLGAANGKRNRVRNRTTTIINTAPVISGTPVAMVVAGSEYSFTPVASDTNSDALTFSIQNLPGWAVFNTSTGQLSGQPTAAAVGSYSNIVIAVSDGVVTTALQAFAIAVTQSADGSATLSWTAPTENTDGSALTDLAGYRIYYGNNSETLTDAVDIPTVGMTTYQVTGLGSGTWYFAIKARNATGVESDLSNVAIKTIQL